MGARAHRVTIRFDAAVLDEHQRQALVRKLSQARLTESGGELALTIEVSAPDALAAAVRAEISVRAAVELAADDEVAIAAVWAEAVETIS